MAGDKAGLVIPDLPEIELNQLFARFKQTYEEGSLWSWVSELFPVKASVTDSTRFVMERTLTSTTGCLTFGVHLNGYVRTGQGSSYGLQNGLNKNPHSRAN